MNVTITDLKKRIGNLGNQYYKMMFIIFKDYSVEAFSRELTDTRTLNINLQLSEKLLVIPPKDYYRHVNEYLLSFMDDDKIVYILNHIDILFDPVLEIHPINILENISRQRKIVVIWPGEYREGRLSYAEPQHSEYFKTQVPGNLVIMI